MTLGRGILILGAGGHAAVAAEAWRSVDGIVRAFYDDDSRLHGTARLGTPVEGPIEAALASGELLHIGIGNNGARQKLAARLADDYCPTIIHSRSIVSPSATLGPGTLICAGAAVQTKALIGRHCIINTSAIIEHDTIVEDFVHVAPGAKLAGGVRVGAGAFLGLGAMILPNVRIGAGAVVGGGAVVLADVPPGSTIAGNPAIPLGRRH